MFLKDLFTECVCVCAVGWTKSSTADTVWQKWRKTPVKHSLRRPADPSSGGNRNTNAAAPKTAKRWWLWTPSAQTPSLFSTVRGNVFTRNANRFNPRQEVSLNDLLVRPVRLCEPGIPAGPEGGVRLSATGTRHRAAHRRCQGDAGQRVSWEVLQMCTGWVPLIQMFVSTLGWSFLIIFLFYKLLVTRGCQYKSIPLHRLALYFLPSFGTMSVFWLRCLK